MALLFQGVLYAVHYMKAWSRRPWPDGERFRLGLTDMDALTMSMTRSIGPDVTPLSLAARSRLASSPTR